jgi:hypothetical protein
MERLTFWPDYTGALLWTDRGERVSLEDIVLPGDLVERAEGWTAGYDDSKLPWEATRDDAWLAEGQRLFADLRRELESQGIDLVSDEDFWAADARG